MKCGRFGQCYGWQLGSLVKRAATNHYWQVFGCHFGSWVDSRAIRDSMSQHAPRDAACSA